jgi:hypothetical protein
MTAPGAEVHIPSGGFALVVSRERIRLSASYACTIGYHSELARHGLFLLAGLQVDPGFNGHLVVGLINYLQTSHTLRPDDPIITLEFYRLGRRAENPHTGTQGEQIPAEDADYIRRSPTTGMADVSVGMQQMSTELERLRNKVDTLVVPLQVGVVLGILAFALKVAFSF